MSEAIPEPVGSIASLAGVAEQHSGAASGLQTTSLNIGTALWGSRSCRRSPSRGPTTSSQPRASRPVAVRADRGLPVRIRRGGRVHRPGPDRRVAPARSPSNRPGRNPRRRVRAGPGATQANLLEQTRRSA
jgi:hypothetical protein